MCSPSDPLDDWLLEERECALFILLFPAGVAEADAELLRESNLSLPVLGAWVMGVTREMAWLGTE